MFNKETYIIRRAELKKLVGNGVVVLFGNNESPANYPANSYAPMRQDSSFLYYFGQHRDGLVGVIDIDKDEEKHPFPAALPSRYKDPDHGPARHPSFETEGGRLTATHQGRGEDAFYKGAAGDRRHRTGL